MRYCNILLVLLVLFIASCKDDEQPKPEEIIDTVEDSIPVIRYDIADFSLELISDTKKLPEKIVVTANGNIIGIAPHKDLSNSIVMGTDSYGAWNEAYSFGGRIYDIKVDTDGVVYAISQNGLLVSSDNGNTWVAKTFTGITWGKDLTTATTMNISVNNGKILLCRNWGDYSGNDVFYSADFGTSFSKVFTSNVQENRGTVVSDDLYYITTLFTEIHSSSDAQNWESVYEGVDIKGVYFDRTDDQLFVSYGGIGRRSENFGKSWTVLPSSDIPLLKMSNGDYLSYFRTNGIYRSNDLGISWLPLSDIKNYIDAIVEHKDRLILNDGSGLYVLEYGKTYWNYVPNYEPVNQYYNFGAKNLYSFNGQLFIREDENSPWRLTLTFPSDQKVAYYTRAYYNRIYVVTQNSFGGNTILHQINPAGNYIEKSSSLPWTGGVTHFVSNPAYMAAVFKGNGNERDYIAYSKYGRGDWTAINLPTDYQKIHFIKMNFGEILTIGYEGKQSKQYQEYATVGYLDLIENETSPNSINFVGTGWPGFYEYEKLHNLVSTSTFALAFLDDDMYVSEPKMKSWTKSTIYETMDANKKNVLRYSDFTHDGKAINSKGVYSKAIELITK